jgi:hypothetical protein
MRFVSAFRTDSAGWISGYNFRPTSVPVLISLLPLSSCWRLARHGCKLLLMRRVRFMLGVLFAALWVALAVEWIRSYWICDLVFDDNLQNGTDGMLFESDRGWIRFKHYSYPREFISQRGLGTEGITWTTHPPTRTDWAGGHGTASPAVLWYGAGFGMIVGDYDHNRLYGPMSFRLFVVPFAFPFGIATVVMAILLPQLLRDRRKRHRLAEGRCQHCGYDLRASSMRCPECGAPSAGDSGQGSIVRSEAGGQ